MAFENGYALVIGVGSYQYVRSANIPISVSDAQAVREVLQNGDLCGYPPEQVTLLHDEGATRAGILAGLDALAAKVKAEDTFLLYYCGHGDYGTNGNYYLTTHDLRLSQDRILPGTGISVAELLDKLRSIPAKRLLLLFNACHSGEISPSLGLGGGEKAFGDVNPPQDEIDALLSTGEGRVIITASRPEQRSWIGKGKLSIFTQALVDGLSGKGSVANNHGYVSAFSLYESMYFSIQEAAQALGKNQEPELTVLRGIGPFPVSLYRGASSLGDFAPEGSLPAGTATRAISPAQSQRLFQQLITTVKASGERAVAIGGNVSGITINTGDQQTINTGGGEYTGRDKKIFGDEVHGNKVGGDQFNIGDISGTGIAIGRNARAQVTTGETGEDLDDLFAPIFLALRNAPPERREDAVKRAEELKTEAAKGKNADDSRMAKLLDGLVELVPGAVTAVLSTFATPVLAGIAGPVTKFVLDKFESHAGAQPG